MPLNFSVAIDGSLLARSPTVEDDSVFGVGTDREGARRSFDRVFEQHIDNYIQLGTLDETFASYGWRMFSEGNTICWEPPNRPGEGLFRFQIDRIISV